MEASKVLVLGNENFLALLKNTANYQYVLSKTYNDALNKIYNEDCLGDKENGTGMWRIPDKSIDMILCDLPFGQTRLKWDAIIPLDKLWKHYKRIIKETPNKKFNFLGRCFFFQKRTKKGDFFRLKKSALIKNDTFC